VVVIADELTVEREPVGVDVVTCRGIRDGFEKATPGAQHDQAVRIAGAANHSDMWT